MKDHFNQLPGGTIAGMDMILHIYVLIASVMLRVSQNTSLLLSEHESLPRLKVALISRKKKRQMG